MYWEAFWMFKTFPLIRFPGFLMGVLGGVYVYRVQNEKNCCDKNGIMNVMLPLTILPINCCTDRSCGTKKESENVWKNRVEFCSGILAVIVFGLIGARYHQKYDGELNNRIMRLFLNESGISQPILQYVLLNCIVTILMGLCLDGNRSFTAKITRIKLFTFYGEISYQLYVLQYPVFYFITLARDQHMISPGSSELFIWIVPPLVAYFVKIILDDPISRLLKC